MQVRDALWLQLRGYRGSPSSHSMYTVSLFLSSVVGDATTVVVGEIDVGEGPVSTFCSLFAISLS